MNVPASHIPNRDERDVLLEKYHRLICGLANYWHTWNPTVKLEDLMQEGRIALLRAREIYDPSKGEAFLTYSRRRINADMRTHVANTRDTIRIPSDHFRKIRVPTCSLDLIVGDDDGTPLALQDAVAEPEQEPQLSDDIDLKTLARAAAEKLKPMHRTVIHQLFFVTEPLSRKELGSSLGISRQAVEQKLNKALKILRKSPLLKGALS